MDVPAEKERAPSTDSKAAQEINHAATQEIFKSIFEKIAGFFPAIFVDFLCVKMMRFHTNLTGFSDILTTKGLIKIYDRTPYIECNFNPLFIYRNYPYRCTHRNPVLKF